MRTRYDGTLCAKCSSPIQSSYFQLVAKSEIFLIANRPFALQLLDALEDDIPKGGYLIDWHACDLFPKSWIDLVVVLRCPTTDVLYDRLSSRYDNRAWKSISSPQETTNMFLSFHRGYHEKKLEENLDAEIFGVLMEEAREAFDEEIVVELTSEQDSDVDSNCQRISQWVESWKQTQAENAD